MSDTKAASANSWSQWSVLGFAAAGFGLGVIASGAFHRMRRRRWMGAHTHGHKHGECSHSRDEKVSVMRADVKSAAAAAPKSAPAKGGIVVLGSVNADMFMDVQQLPREGETISASVDPDYVKPGGKGANQAVAAHRLSASTAASAPRVSFIGRFGSDAHGGWVRQQMTGVYGVDIGRSTTADNTPQGQAYIFLSTATGQNSIVLVPAANAAWPNASGATGSPLTSEQESIIASASILLLQREIPDAVNLVAARVARKAGVKVMLDAGGFDVPISDELLACIDILAPNETELARLSGLPTETDTQITAAVHALMKRGVRNVLVTLGSTGSRFYSQPAAVSAAAGADTKTEFVSQPIIRANKVVDTTGAGDCYRAAFAVALTENKSYSDCMQFAAAAAALCVEVKGAMPSMPHREATAAFLKERTK